METIRHMVAFRETRGNMEDNAATFTQECTSKLHVYVYNRRLVPFLSREGEGMRVVTVDEFERYQDEVMAELEKAGIVAVTEAHDKELDAFHNANLPFPACYHPTCSCWPCVLNRRVSAHFGLTDKQHVALLDASRPWIV
jgi:hypothetical protein